MPQNLDPYNTPNQDWNEQARREGGKDMNTPSAPASPPQNSGNQNQRQSQGEVGYQGGNAGKFQEQSGTGGTYKTGGQSNSSTPAQGKE